MALYSVRSERQFCEQLSYNRKRVEEIFGWARSVGGFRRTRFRGRSRTQLTAYVVGAAYNLVRMSRLVPAA